MRLRSRGSIGPTDEPSKVFSSLDISVASLIEKPSYQKLHRAPGGHSVGQGESNDGGNSSDDRGVEVDLGDPGDLVDLVDLGDLAHLVKADLRRFPSPSPPAVAPSPQRLSPACPSPPGSRCESLRR